MTKKPISSGLPATRKKYTPAFEAECVRQVAAGTRQSDVARAQGTSPALLGRWQRQALEAATSQQRGARSCDVAAGGAGGLYALRPPVRYGTRRLRVEWQAEGHAVGRYALRSWLHRNELRALSTRPHRPRTTVADPAAVVAENRLLGQPAPTAPDQVWVGDITYLPLVGGRWCYLATWRATYSRRVVGWHLAAQMPTELVLEALEQALTLRPPAPGLISHAERGSQYTSPACRARIDQAGAVPSSSRPANPYDNAQAEAGWSTLKTELLPDNAPFASLEEARLEVAWYLDTYFHLDRRHSALGHRSPHQVELDLKINLP